ncbi:FecR domain-containing protein [Pseudocolwellia sp. HL-MZ19]|uniref:FecR domain-containing protein n=1 Tax=Pseudocolwellia sp. HL-MZ19 TaxID=3400846 RepID=UPI003CF3D2E1
MKKILVSLITCMVFLLSTVEVATADEKKPWVYVVSNGDSLWNISSKFLKNIDYYTQLQQLNNIKYPKRMKPGTVIRIPMEWIKHTPVSAHISFLKGESQFLRNKVLNPLTSSTTLVLGDEVRTGDNGSATVIFADGSEMVLFKNTIVAFDHLSAYGKTGMVDTRIRVIQGKVETNAQKNKGPGSRLDISTPSAISSVRGTVYRVSNTGKNISTVEVLEGTVAVAGEQPNNIIKVATGQGTRIEKGEEPTKPVPLLAPPTITTLQTLFEKAPKIQWVENNKAEKYNIQLSEQNNFKSILWGQSTSNTSIILPELADGIYYYRITATDTLGIEGLPVVKKFTLNLVPSAPKLNHSPKKILGYNQLSTLEWAASIDGADSYQIEIAKDEQFTETVVNKTITATQIQLSEDLAFGDYFWRVSSIKDLNTGIDKGPASDVLAFNWKTILTAPNCKAEADSESDSNTVSVIWSPIKSNQTAIIQIAQDAEFTKITETYQFDANTSTVQFDANEEAFVRCKLSLNDSSLESQWGNTQHISQLDKGILSMFGFLLLVILI